VTAAGSRRPLRADARANREKLVASAAALFAADGADASLDAVAKAAGVGIGTLYRHFPTRDALVEAVYQQEVDRLCDAADELLRVHPPDVAIEAWMQRFVGYVAAKRGLAGALKSIMASNSDLFVYTKARFTAAMSMLLDAAIAAGTVRADLDAEDVLHAMGGVLIIPDDAQWNPRVQRMLRLLMDGLRVRAPSS
jgi:AcrR family transcriptional regulator